MIHQKRRRKNFEKVFHFLWKLPAWINSIRHRCQKLYSERQKQFFFYILCIYVYLVFERQKEKKQQASQKKSGRKFPGKEVEKLFLSRQGNEKDSDAFFKYLLYLPSSCFCSSSRVVLSMIFFFFYCGDVASKGEEKNLWNGYGKWKLCSMPDFALNGLLITVTKLGIQTVLFFLPPVLLKLPFLCSCLMVAWVRIN